MQSIDLPGKERVTRPRPRNSRRVMSAKARLAMAALLGACAAGRCLGGTVKTDGSLGGATNLVGPNFAVTANLGKQVGPNLFHSFTTFNLDKGEIATFSGPTNVTNVIARVTGGTSSTIDGTIQCTIPSAHFFLINPSGVVFGPDAALDVKGSFVVTTADYLKASDGSHFNATHLADTTLTSAPPAAFGFLSSNPAPIAVNGPTLAVTAGSTVSIVGGQVQISNGIVAAPSGRVNVVSVASSGEVAFDPISPTADINIAPGAVAFGDVSLSSNFTGINTSGPGGGKVSIRAGTLEMNNALILAGNSGATDAPGVDIVLTGNATLSASAIIAGSTGAGRSGSVNLTAAAVIIDGTGVPELDTGISTTASATGRAGDINIKADSFKLSNGSALFANTIAAGDGGTVTISTTGDLRIDGLNASATGIYAGSRGAGQAGNVVLSAGTFELTNGGVISAATSSSGNGGSIAITAGSISVDDNGGAAGITGIVADALSGSTAAHAGQITFTASSVSVTNGAEISASTSTPAAAGSIVINGGAITLDGATSGTAPGLFATSLNTGSGGPAGSIQVTGSSLQVLGGAVVAVNSNGGGAAGNITVNVSNLMLDNRQLSTTPFAGTGLFANSNAPMGSASAGQITVQADTVSILGGAKIIASGLGSGPAGTISITASQSVTVNGQNTGLATGIFADGTDGPAGSVSVSAPAVSFLAGGWVSTSAFGAGSAGTISVTASQGLLIDGQESSGITGLFANTTDGAGGNVTVVGGDISILGGGFVTVGSFGSGPAGNVTITGRNFTLQDPTGGDSLVVASSLGNGTGGTVNLTVDTMNLGSGGHIDGGTSGSGNAGTINVSANSVTVDGGGTKATLDAVTQGSGQAGTVNLQTGTLTVVNGGQIDANTQAAGHGGTVNITAGAITLNGQGAAGNTGIYAESVLPPGGVTTGDAGTVHVQAGSLQILNGAAISTSTAGATAAGGTTNVVVTGALTIDSQSSALLTGIFANSLFSGTAGGVNVKADSITLLNQGAISSNANSTGPAGTVTVQANSLTISSGGGITSNAYSTGNGGNVNVTVVKDLTITGVSINDVTGITANSYNDNGNAGNVTVSAGTLLLRGTGFISTDTDFGGAGGNVVVNANTITVQTNSLISSGTFGSGNGGNVTVTGKHIVLDARGAATITGITAQTNGAGNAGAVQVNATNLQLLNGGEINSTSFAGGAGGKVTIDATDLTLRKIGFIDSASTGTGVAGSIEMHIARSLNLFRSEITSQSNQVSGGDMRIFAGNMFLQGSKISAQAKGDGGTIKIICPGTIDLLNSQILTRAGDNGGNMIIDPSFVILENSLLSANGGNNGGNITVDPVWLLESQSSITATGARGVSGTLQITPDYNLTGALVGLPAALSDNLALEPQCAADLAGNTSSFIVTGRGGEPLTPGGFTPAINLRIPPGKKAH